MPIIAMTAHALQGDRDRCMEAGMDGYVTKPVLIDALRAEMARVLGPETETPDHILTPAGPQGASSMSDNLFDRDWMLAQIGGDEDLMHEVIQIFIDSFDELHGEILAAVESGEPTRVREAAHAAKGAVGNFGAAEVVAAALALENAGKVADQAHFGKLCSQLSPLMQQLRKVLEEELAKT